MKKTALVCPALVLFESFMEEARAAFELDCSQACRGLKVSMAVNVFGVGTLLPNNLADEHTEWTKSITKTDTGNKVDTNLPANFTMIADNAEAAVNSKSCVSEFYSRHQE